MQIINTTTAMSSNAEILFQEIITVGQLLYDRRLVVARDGNISARLNDTQIIMTATGTCKGRLQHEDIVIVDMQGHVQEGQGRPSSEMQLHLAVYHQRPDVQAVIHAHPPLTIACTLAGKTFDEELLPELIMTLGSIPTVPYTISGSPEMNQALAPLLTSHNAIVLSHHGAVTFGETLMRAYMRMEQVEHTAQILIAAHQLGGPRPLPAAQIAQLKQRKSR